MTDYNDGEWHRWDGGECPVHPDSEVEVRLLDSSCEDDDMVDYGRNWVWTMRPSDATSIIAFRVTKVHEELKVPREFWIANNIVFNCEETVQRYCSWDIIHVREVLPE